MSSRVTIPELPQPLKRVQARVRARRLASMARQKIEDANRDGLVLPKDLRRELEAVASGGVHEKRAEAALAEALAISLNQTKGETVSREQRKLAEKLRGKERTTTLNEWLEQHVPPTEESDRKVDAALAELTMLGGSTEAAVFASRQLVIQKEHRCGVSVCWQTHWTTGAAQTRSASCSMSSSR
jgi:hypothetical protein